MFRTRPAAVAAAGLLAFALAACGGGGATNAPSAPAASPPAASPSSAAEICAPTDEGGTVSAGARGFAFNPTTVTVPVGQAVTWSNGDPAPHSVVLDGGECQTEQFGEGESATLVFNVAGSYPFHCGVHATMTGTIEVS
jgi:plastocyanin